MTTHKRRGLKPYEIPRCQLLRRREPEPESCTKQARFRVESFAHGKWWTRHTCLAHLAEAVEWADADTDSERLRQSGYTSFGPQADVPQPRIYRLTYTIDTNAKAYGRNEAIPHEQLVTAAQLALF